MDEILIQDFMKIDLRVAQIKTAEKVEGADKLVKLILDLGESRTRTVFAGIKEAYPLSKLTNKYVVYVNNLKSREMRFGISEGMILAAGDEDQGIFIISPEEGAFAGMQVK